MLEIMLTLLQGRVSSFYGAELSRYTSFKAHASAEGPVRQILIHDKGVIALGSRGVHMARRTGPPIWHILCGSWPIQEIYLADGHTGVMR